MPPPGTPMLPSRSWIIAAERMFCEPLECWVQPSAYMIVMVRSPLPVEPIISHTVRNLSCGVPVIRSTTSGVYCAKCAFISWNTQRGSASVMSRTAKPSAPISYSQDVRS